MKNIFKSERDHFKWSKQKEYLAHLETIDDETRFKAIEAICFLEKEFGRQFLKITTINHPLRLMISNKTPYQIKDLIEFTNTLQILKKQDNNYNRLLLKLLSQKDAKTEGIALVNVARLFSKEKFVISFLEEVKKHRTPDLKISNLNNKDIFYIEITKLNISDNNNHISNNYNFFHKQFHEIQPLFPFYGHQLKSINEGEYIEIANIITNAKKRVKEENQIIYYADHRFNFLLAPSSDDNDFNEVCNRNNIRPIHFEGLPINLDETSRINNKISKAYQIPEEKNGILFIAISPLYFLTTELSEAIERLESNIAKHKNLLGIILFSEIVATKESKVIKIKNHIFTRKTIENLCRESLFIYNKSCDIKLSKGTIEKIYKALS